jgi:hypothetical protein
MRFFFFAFLLSFKAFAYQSSLNSGAKALAWPNNQIPLTIKTNTTDISSSTTANIIQQSVNEWNAHSSTQIQTTSSSLSEVSFKSDFSVYGPGVIGVTELTFTSGGSIQQAKIYLNDEDYNFKSSPGLYSSGEVFLGDVVTHELGHLLGLSHSEVLEASMFYAAFPGQSTLSSDDKAGIKSKYGSGNGTITGVVHGGDDVGVLGVHVVAFSRITGDAIGVISDQSGNFSIKGLDLNDTYYLYTSSLKNLAALPGQFANVQTDFCPASYVGGFFDACGKENEGYPQGITLTNSVPSANVGAVTIHCSLKNNEVYGVEKLQLIPDPVTIFDYAVEERFEKAFVGNFITRSSTAWSAYDKLVLDLTGFTEAALSQKYLRLNFIARQFGNLLEYEMIVLRNGSPLGTYQISRSLVTQTYDTDMTAFLPLSTNPANNVFEVQIRARKISTVIALQTFAALEQFVSNQYLPYLLIAGLETGAGPLLDTTALLSDNAACLDAPFTYAVSNARTLSSTGEVTQKNDDVAPVSCGTTSGTPPDDGGPGNALMVLGFLMAIVLSSVRKTAKNFLS